MYMLKEIFTQAESKLKIDPNNVHKTLGRYILADGLPIVFDQANSHGAYIRDAKTNKDYLDLFSFFASQPIGFNHPKLNTKAFKEKLGEIAIHRPSLSDIYTQDFAAAIETFDKIANHQKAFKHFFFIEGGTLGVENALKVAFDWKVRKNQAKGISGEVGSKVIHFKKAFHGRSGYTLSLTNTHDPKKYMNFPKFTDWPRITPPAIIFPINEDNIQTCIKNEQQALNEIKQALNQYPNDIAALIIEPIQGEGGDNHFRDEFFIALRKLADEHEFMLIFDEVQTGLGLTGKMWCFEHYSIKPDIIAFGKKAQVAGCAVSSRVDEVKDNVFELSSRINSTWGSNLVDLMRMQRMLEIIDEDHLLDNVNSMGQYFMTQLQDFVDASPYLSNLRGRGLMIAFDFKDTEQRDAFRKHVFSQGAIMLGCGEKSVRLRCHLDFTQQNADHALQILKKAHDML